jgi:hypothetical protein
MVQLGYDREDIIINRVTGQPGRTPEQDSQDRTARSGQPGQDSWNRILGTGQPALIGNYLLLY